jgi:hypothetical protein
MTDVGDRHPAWLSAVGSRNTQGTEMAKLMQICASANDLFGLDENGVAYQYNFKTNNWMRLGHGRRDQGASQGEAQPTIDQGIGLDNRPLPPTASRATDDRFR